MTTRRALLGSAAALALAAGGASMPAAALTVGPAGPTDPDRARAQMLARLATAGFGDPAAAARIGRACRALGVAPAPGPALAALIDVLAPTGTGGPREAAEMRARLAALVRADHAAGRVVTAAGWILSETEAALCATLDRAGEA